VGVWKKIGLAVLGLAVVGAVAKRTEQPPRPLSPPETGEQQALERCTAAMWLQYGHGGVTGPGGDRWPVKRTGGMAALYTVQGRNAFGMPVVNTVECEVSRDAKGEWRVPFMWNVTLHDDRLDPSSLEARPAKRPRGGKPPDPPDVPQARYDENGAETVTANGRGK
jgi:hypothetical protein